MAKHVVGYFENWAQYRQSGGKFLPAQINPSFFTHINFAFGLFGFVTWSVDPNPARTGPQRYTGDYTVQPVEWNDQTVLYPAIQALKQQNGNLKTLLSIGGWSMNSGDDTPNPGNPHPYGPYTYKLFSQMAADPNGRMQFINSAIAYAEKYGFDGIDIDWEYPGYISRGGDPSDLANFLALAHEFRAAAGPNFLLTMAAPAIVPTGLPQSYHDDPTTFFSWLQQCSQSFDWLNVMSYDYHGAFDDPVAIGTGVNSPLPQDSTPNGPFSVFQTVTTYLAAGIPADKMVLGMPTYGRAYTVANPAALSSNNSYGQPFSGPAPAGPATQVPSVLAYYEIEQQVASGALTTVWDNATLTPYAYNSTTGEWVSYDNPDSVAYKTAYINAMNLGGAMIWSIDDDDFANGYPLLSKITDILNNPADGPQLPGTLSSQVDFPFDLLGVFMSDLTSEPLVAADTPDKTISEGKAKADLVSLFAGISGAPGVVDYNGEEWFFYEGAGESGVIGCSTRDLTTGEVATKSITNKNNGATGIPAVAVYDNKIYCVHEGAGQSGKLYYFTYDGALEQWTDDEEIPTPVVAGSDRHNYPSVALAVYRGALYCVYEGGKTRGGGQLWNNFYTTKDGWSNGFLVGSGEHEFGTSNGPALAVIDDNLICWHEGAFQDGQLWRTNLNGSFDWSLDKKVNVSTSGPPALAVVNVDETTRKLFVIHEGPNQNGVLRSFNNNLFEDEPLILPPEKGLFLSTALTHGTPTLVWDMNQFMQLYGESRVTGGGNAGSGKLYSYKVKVSNKATIRYKLTLGERATAPYSTLDNYAINLRDHNPLNVMGNFPVVMSRHHIVPVNLLVQLWNTMLDRGQMAGRNGGAYGTALLQAMALYLSFYQTTTNNTDRLRVFLLLQGIQFGFVQHDPNGRPPDNIDTLADVYEWLPGNLFIGPDGSWRSDDPGRNFESNAFDIVGRGWQTYVNANEGIQAYYAGRVPNPSRAILNLAGIAAQTSPFALDPTKWFYNPRQGKFALNVIPQSEPQSQAEESVAAQ